MKCYPVDSVTQPLNNLGQGGTSKGGSVLLKAMARA